MDTNKIRMVMMTACCLAFASMGANAQNLLSDVEEGQGFVSLFDGSLSGFNDHFVNYIKGDSDNVVLSSAWALDPDQGAIISDGITQNHTRSVKAYRDFDVRFDFRNTGDGGFLYRFTVAGDYPWTSGVEYAIEDNEDNCLICAGAALGLYGPTPKVYHPFATGLWNQARLVVIGDSVEHWLNGKILLAYRYHSADFWKHFDASKWANTSLTFKVPGARWAGAIDQGFIGFQATDKGKWMLKNIRINEKHPEFGGDKWWIASAGIADIHTRHSIHRAATGPGIYLLPDGSFINLKGRVARSLTSLHTYQPMLSR